MWLVRGPTGLCREGDRTTSPGKRAVSLRPGFHPCPSFPRHHPPLARTAPQLDPSTDLPDKSPVTGSLTIRNERMRNPKQAQENTELYDTFEVGVTHPRFDRLIKLTASPEKGKPR